MGNLKSNLKAKFFPLEDVTPPWERKVCTLRTLQDLDLDYLLFNGRRVYYVGGGRLLLAERGHRELINFKLRDGVVEINARPPRDDEFFTPRDSWNCVRTVISERIRLQYPAECKELTRYYAEACKNGEHSVVMPLLGGMTEGELRDLYYQFSFQPTGTPTEFVMDLSCLADFSQ